MDFGLQAQERKILAAPAAHLASVPPYRLPSYNVFFFFLCAEPQVRPACCLQRPHRAENATLQLQSRGKPRRVTQLERREANAQLNSKPP